MKIELDKVIEALEFTNDEIEYYYNPDTEEIFMSNIREFENLTEGEYTVLGNYEREDKPFLIKHNICRP